MRTEGHEQTVDTQAQSHSSTVSTSGHVIVLTTRDVVDHASPTVKSVGFKMRALGGTAVSNFVKALDHFAEQIVGTTSTNGVLDTPAKFRHPH